MLKAGSRGQPPVANLNQEDDMDIFEKVKELIADRLDVEDKDSISEDSSITDDLGADSLDVVDLVMDIEENFNIEIPEDQVENIKTVGDIVKYIEDNQ